MLWGLQPVQQQAAYGLTVELLRRQVHLGLLSPGERLPAERALAEQLGVSRVTLREALRVLQTEGYLRVRRGASGGAFVAAADALRELALRRIGRDPAAPLRVLEFREANETAAARAAATRRTPGDLAALGAAVEAARSAADLALLRRAESQFQIALGAAAHNTLLARAIEEALAATFLPFASEPESGSLRDVVRGRERLLEAIRQRDPVGAEQAMRLVLARERAQMQVLPDVA